MPPYTPLKNPGFTILDILIERLFVVEKELEIVVQTVESSPVDLYPHPKLSQQQHALIDQRESLCAGIKLLLTYRAFLPDLSRRTIAR